MFTGERARSSLMGPRARTHSLVNACRQRLIVGGWMVAKEAGACLAEIVRQAAAPSRSPLQQKGRGKEKKERAENWTAPSLVGAIGGVERVDAVGRMLLRALGRMKHMGGIQCTQVQQLSKQYERKCKHACRHCVTWQNVDDGHKCMYERITHIHS